MEDEGRAFRWLYDIVREDVAAIPHVTIVSGYEIEFDRWHWGPFPSLVRRGELVVMRETKDVSHLFGLRHANEPIVGLEALADGVGKGISLPPISYCVDGMVVFQRLLGYRHLSDKYHGSGLRPLLEHVEVREHPFLEKEFMHRVESHNPIAGRPLYRQEGAFPPEFLFDGDRLVDMEELREAVKTAQARMAVSGLYS